MSDLVKKDRWENPATHRDGWNARTFLLVNYLSSSSKILEIGCGRKIIQDYLFERGVAYISTDLNSLSEPDLVLDLEDRPFVSLEHLGHFSVLASGVFEYVTRINEVFSYFAECADELAVSYHPFEEKKKDELINRTNLGWMSHLSLHEFLGMAHGAGWGLANVSNEEDEYYFHFLNFSKKNLKK